MSVYQGREMRVGEGSAVVSGEVRRERSDAVRSRRKILDAARTLFEERGVESVSMHEIGRSAGVGQGTLYRRFRHKGELCSALLREEIEQFVEESRRRVEGRGPALGRLKWFLGWVSRFNEENGALLGAIRDAAGGERRVELYDNPFYGRLRQTVVGLLEEAAEEGAVKPDLDVECIADTLLAALNIDLYLYQRHELGMERERIVAALRSLLDALRT
jgi:AcrR family transcriptional regulator